MSATIKDAKIDIFENVKKRIQLSLKVERSGYKKRLNKVFWMGAITVLFDYDCIDHEMFVYLYTIVDTGGSVPING